MSRHATVEELSSLLDDELGSPSRDRVERHLAICPSCRGRLASLRSVVSTLARLERVAPPTTLGREVERRVRWEPARQGPLESLEHRLRSIPLQPSIAPVFALVVALAAIMVFFASGLERQRRGTPVRLEVPSAEQVESTPAVRRVAGRDFELRDGVWVEQGVGNRAPVARFHPADPGARPWLSELPDPSALEPLGGTVRLLAGEEVVEIRFEP